MGTVQAAAGNSKDCQSTDECNLDAAPDPAWADRAKMLASLLGSFADQRQSDGAICFR